MNFKSIQKSSFLSKWIYKIWLWDAQNKLDYIQKFLSKSDKILDLGSGPGSVTQVLRERGFQVTPLDVVDISLNPEFKPQLFNGKTIPYPNQSFDIILILTVLHHVQNPDLLLKEAQRVGKRIIIIEDIYSNKIQQYLTYWTDSIVNLEFKGHPHSNRTDKMWKQTFQQMGMQLESCHSYRFLAFYRQVVYFLKSNF